jgi:predicted TIM-barrel fold metal-dependent hydrolase
MEQTAMTQNGEKIYRTKHKGVIDADGHVLEDATLWERYCEEKYRPYAVRLGVDDEGYQRLEVNGKPSKFIHHGVLGILGAMGMLSRENWRWDFHRKWGEVAAWGAVNARERIERLEKENLAGAIIYPTIGLGWECECPDADVAQAMCRAYNRWIIDWCSESGGKLIPVAHLSLMDPPASAREMERAVKDGCKGAWVGSFCHTRKPHGHPDHDPLFAKAQELDIPLGIHPTVSPLWAHSSLYDRQYTGHQRFFDNVVGTDAARQVLTSLIQHGTFDKFPNLKIVMLESGAGWVSYLLDRWDDVWKSHFGHTLSIKEKPSEYFRRNIYISADPDEHALPAMLQLCGEDRFFWASDFPHPDHIGDYLEELDEIAAKLKPAARKKLLGENVRQAYHLSV